MKSRPLSPIGAALAARFQGATIVDGHANVVSTVAPSPVPAKPGAAAAVPPSPAPPAEETP